MYSTAPTDWGTLRKRSHPSAEIQSAYSTAPWNLLYFVSWNLLNFAWSCTQDSESLRRLLFDLSVGLIRDLEG